VQARANAAVAAAQERRLLARALALDLNALMRKPGAKEFAPPCGWCARVPRRVKKLKRRLAG